MLKGKGFPGTGNNTGEVESPLPLTSGNDTGELRLQSDFALARDERTACFWQGFVNQQEFMASSFQSAFQKMAVLGSNPNDLIDCSDVIPTPKPAVNKPATFPATTGPEDLQLTCTTAKFPTLSVDRESYRSDSAIAMYLTSLSSTDGSQETLIPHCSDGSQSCATTQFLGPASDSPADAPDPEPIL